MRDVWDKFAGRDAEFYISTRKNVDYSTPQGQKTFYQSGETLTEKWLSRVQDMLPGYSRALEIGCGIGRLSLPHAGRFGEVHAVDVSPTMIERLGRTARERRISNIVTYLPDDPWDMSAHFDYAYSFNVFQHIEDYRIIAAYVDRVARALKPRGCGQFHFDTRPATVLYRVRNAVPDSCLPRTQKRGIRRVRRDARDLRGLFAKYGLEIVREQDAGTSHHTIILRRPG